jgi:hypothetical protein
MSRTFSSPSPISKLPVELLKQIVRAVKAQDIEFEEDYEVFRARGPKPDELLSSGDEADENEDQEAMNKPNINMARFACEYGRGVHSLSLVNRLFRLLASPYVFEVRGLPSVPRLQRV